MAPAAKFGAATDVAPAAMAAAKLGMMDKLLAAVEKQPSLLTAVDGEGRTCLHHAAAYGHEECVERLLEKQFDPLVQDHKGETALHLAAIQGCPMSAFNLTKAAPVTCLAKNQQQQRPADVAKACERGEVLNAMLLACSGDATSVAVDAMQYLLQEGAVPDTWAPNGSSALMLAASADGVAAIQLLLKHGATIELQDALGRSALMFAAGNCAEASLLALLAAGATLGLRDRRSRNVLDYAPEGSKVKQQLLDRLKELEAAAEHLQAALLAELNAPASGAGAAKKKGKAKKGKKKQAAAADPAEAVLASSLHAATSSQPSATDSSQPCLAASLATSTAHAAAVQPQKAAWPQADLPAAVEQPTCSAGATDNHQIGTISEHNMDCVSRDDCLARSPPSTGTADPHCQHRLKPEASSPTLSASSCRLLGGSQPPTTPTSERSTSPPAPASAAPPRHDIHHQVAVLSVLAGVAVDQASSLKQSRPPDANNMSAEPQSLDEDPRTGGGDSQEARSASSSPIYRALREDMPQGEDWQVVKGSRKGGTNVVKATPDSVTHELSRAAAQHEVLSARREQPVTAHSRSQEAAREAAEEASANLNGCAPHQAKPVRPSPSQASMSSWASFDTTGTQDRSHPRPGRITLAQLVRPSHMNKPPPPPPAFKLPPAPPPGPPPSAPHPASTSAAASSQGTSVPAPPPHRNAWAQPLTNQRLSQPIASRLDPDCFSKEGDKGLAVSRDRPHSSQRQAAHGDLSAGSSDHMLSCEESHGSAVSSSNGGDTVGTKSGAYRASAEGQQAGAACSGPAQVMGPAGQSCTAAGGAARQGGFSKGAGQYPQEAHHVAQIADLQEEVTALRGDVAHLFLVLKAAEARHQQELAGVIIDAAQHQTKAVAEAIAKERAATAALLQAAAAQQSARQQHRPVASFDSRAQAHVSRQHQQQLIVDQESTLPRSRLGNASSQQAHLSPEQGKPTGLPAGKWPSVHRYSNGRAQDIPTRADSMADASSSGTLTGIMRSPSTEELRDGFRRAASAVPDEHQLSHTKADALMPCFVKTVLPHVASWGNLSTHSSSSNSGLLHSGVSDTISRGLPTFEPTSTPAGLFNSNGSTTCDKGTFPSYLASIWSSDAKAQGLSGSPNSHFEQPCLLNTHL